MRMNKSVLVAITVILGLGLAGGIFLKIKTRNSSEAQDSVSNPNQIEELIYKEYLICDHENWIVCKDQNEFYFRNRLSKEVVKIKDLLQTNGYTFSAIDLTCGDGKILDFKVNRRLGIKIYNKMGKTHFEIKELKN